MSRRDHRVGVRELRQNLSVHLRRVRKGETLEVTEHGHSVAVLSPIPANGSLIDRLIAAGLATAPVGDLLELDPPPRLAGRRKALSRALEESRGERL